MPPAESSSSAESRGDSALFVFSALLALGIHAAVLLLWRTAATEPGLIRVEAGEGIEVTLVEGPPASPLAPTARSKPEPQPAPSAPLETAPVEPPLEEPKTAPVLPTPEPPSPTLPPEPTIPAPPTEQTPPPPPEPVPEKPAPAQVPPAPKRSKAPPSALPTPATKSNPAAPGSREAAPADETGGSGRTGTPQPAPVYKTRPRVQYPPESRAAGEEGVVVLRITVNAEGRPVAVTVASSSGRERLDRAALEGGWRCQIRNAREGAQFEAPIRFSLRD